MVDAGSIWIKLGLDTANLDKGLANVKAGMTTWRDETNAGTRDMMKWGAAIGAEIAPVTAMGYAIYNITEKYGGMAQQLKDLSYTTGVSTDNLQRMQYAAVLSGTNFERVSFALNQLSLSVANSKDQTSAAYRAFMGLGIDPRGKTVDEVFDLTAKAMVDMRDETTRNEIAMTLYGKSWKELLPYMQTYIEKSAEIKANPILSAQELKDLEDAKIGFDALISRATIWAGKVAANSVDGGWLPKTEDIVPKSQTAGLGPEDYDWSKYQTQDQIDAAKRASFFSAYNSETDPIKQQKMLDSSLYGGMAVSKTVGNPQMKNGVHVSVTIGTVVTPNPVQFARTVGGSLDEELQRQRIRAGISS